jgi:adenylosuccinate lyase
MVGARAGANRQAMHEVIREHSMAAWAAIQSGAPNPLAARLAGDERIVGYIPAEEVHALLDAGAYVGDAPARAREMARLIREQIEIRGSGKD